MAPENYVFMSYSQQDRSLADKLTVALRKQGVHVWRDREQIVAGASWAYEIEKGFQGASALIYVGTQYSGHSAWMMAEVLGFLTKGKPIIPIIADNTAVDTLPLKLPENEWIALEEDFDRAADQVVKKLPYEVTTGDSLKFPKDPEKKSKGYVFLSYAKEDADFVKQLRRFIEKYGYAYWDYAESERDYHSQLFLELEERIKEAAATLSVLSEAWKRSPWTVKEYLFSEEIDTPVFLLRAKEMGPTLVIAGIHYIDFVTDEQAGFSKLDKELKRKKL